MEEETTVTQTQTQTETETETETQMVVEEGDDALIRWLYADDSSNENENDDFVVFDDVMKCLDTSASDTDPKTATEAAAMFGGGGGGGECYKVRFISDPYTVPLEAVQSSCAYVTINGNEESCGSSFSDCECSLMAGVDMGGLQWGCGVWGEGETDVGEARVVLGCSDDDNRNGGWFDGPGFDFDDGDDYCLERFLREGA